MVKQVLHGSRKVKIKEKSQENSKAGRGCTVYAAPTECVINEVLVGCTRTSEKTNGLIYGVKAEDGHSNKALCGDQEEAPV